MQYFGYSLVGPVALSADCRTAFILDGSIYIFCASGGAWTFEEGLPYVDPGSFTHISAMSVSSDGSTIIEGARGLLPGAWIFAKDSPASPGPGITNITPNAVPAGSATTITIEGSNFVPGAVVQLNGAALATAYDDANRLEATVPADATATPASESIAVLNPNQQQSNFFPFTVTGDLSVHCAATTLVLDAPVRGAMTAPAPCRVDTVPAGGAVNILEFPSWASATLSDGLLTVTANPDGIPQPQSRFGNKDSTVLSAAGQIATIDVVLNLAPPVPPVPRRTPR